MNKYLPIIEVFKTQNEHLNEKHILKLPDNTPYGNLGLKCLDLVQRFDNINHLIEELDRYYQIIKIEHTDIKIENVKSLFFSKEKFVTEQIFYWLRKSTDELIALLYVLDYNNINGDYPPKIKIDSIGTLIHSTNFYNDFVDKHKHLLTILNEVTNAYKHSFLNTEFHSHHGSDYPVAFALHLKYNTISNAPQFYTINVNTFIIDYCIFLKDIKTLIQIFELEDE